MVLNSSTFKITNSGEYPANVKFFLSSIVKAEEEIFEKSY
jgi:hypothetical protein